jgi:WD40 repeat protein
MNQRGHDLILKHSCWDIAWSTSEQHLVTNDIYGILRKWSNIYESATIVAESSQKCEGLLVAFSSDDRLIATASHFLARLWDASNLSLVWEYLGGASLGVAIHPNGRDVFFFDELSVHDVNAEDFGNITTTEFKLDHSLYRVVLDPGGKPCVAWTQQRVRILSADTFTERASFSLVPFKTMQYTPNGKYLLLVSLSKTVVLWDIAECRVVES